MSAEKAYAKDDNEGVNISYDSSNNPNTAQTGDIIGIGDNEATHRGLKSRHLQLIALGGSIGTGFFVGSGTVLADCGPAPLFMAYICMSALVWLIMLDLGEMTSYMPIRGLSVPYLVNRFVEPSLAFASGWNYWYAYSILIAAEVTAASLVMEYWTPISPAVWISVILVVCLLLNIVAVQLFGEAEFWFSSIKIIAIVGLIITGVVIFFGGAPTHDRLGFRYWRDPGAFNPYMAPHNTGRFLAFWHAMIRAAFAYILSPELITTAAGECVAPRRNIPKATRRYIYRLITFYVIGALVIGVIVPYNSPALLAAINSNASGAAASPFVIGIQRAGIPVLNHIINAVILTSAWSSGNSFLFAGSRMLYGLACTGQAPRIFSKCNRFGVPYNAILASFAVGCLGYLNVSNTGTTVFNWLSNISTVSGFIAWIVVLYTYLRFRKAIIYQGITDRLPFRSRFQPYTTYFTMFLIILLALTNGFAIFFPGELSASSFFAAYVTIPVFFVFYLGHKLWFRTPWAKPIEEIDVFSGLEEVEEITEKDVPPVPRNFLERIWFWIA